ncbi:glycosyltransferase [Clostridium vincentii]|uniref:Putative glycosyltransferase EpsF n=1 Tax=Clostridium vincentii TaxID=52704 RepID=A0A2T0BJM5_9CLOT|nr:glycosyltransferase [Clostridium vincentii]PRR84084.1 putative glycosyltransferase EpsF [Clostridium vincentii]
MMNKILVMVDNLEIGGVARVVRNFCDACSKNSNLIFDYVIYIEPSEETLNELSKAKSKYFVIPRVSETTIFKYINNIRSIIRNNGKYSAIHAHTTYFIWLACYAAKKEKIPVRVGHAHGSEGPYKSLISKVVESSGRFLNRKYCTHMLACAETSGEYTFGSRFEFIPNIIKYDNIKRLTSKQRSDYYEEFNIPKDGIILGYLGVIGMVKNTKFLIPLMKKIVESHKKYYMILAGSGPDEEVIKDMIDKENLTSYVKLIGQRSDNYELLQIFDVLLMPSFSEGMSLSILESQLCSTPCVVSPGVPKTNNIHMNLFYQCNSYNYDDWEKNIRLAYKNKCKTSLEQRINILENIKYDKESIAKKLVEIYNVVKK